MSIGASPSLKTIAGLVGDIAPHAMSEMRGISFVTGNSPTIEAISLSDFRNQVIASAWTVQARLARLTSLEGRDYFGASVSISGDGDTAIVGAYEYNNNINPIPDTGKAYIFVRSGTSWSEQTMFRASDAIREDEFGRSVSISEDGNTAIVGAPLEDNNSPTFNDTNNYHFGAAYIFVRSGTSWSQQQKLTASDRQTNGYFGTSVSISEDGNTAIVGASGVSSNAGAIYIFTRSGTSWSQEDRLQVSSRNDRFGASVSISGDGNTAVVGAPGLYQTGMAYIFARSGTSWSEQGRTSSLSVFGQTVGSGVSISGDGNTTIVGAGKSNRVYILVRSGTSWSEQASFQSSDVGGGDNFGGSVSISTDGNTAIVGASGDDDGGGTTSNTGAAYIFKRSGTSWSQERKIRELGRPAYLLSQFFGTSVSISGDGNTTIVGMPLDDYDDTDSGSALIYTGSYFI
jgi:hypothetical protein